MIVLLTNITIYYLDFIPGFGILTVKLWTPLQGRGTSTTLPCSSDSEAHAVLLRARYFDRSPLAFCSILTFTYNGRFSSGSFCRRLDGPAPLKTTFCMGRHSSGVFGRENLNFRLLAVRISFRSARFFITGVCTSDQGWCSQCSSA